MARTQPKCGARTKSGKPCQGLALKGTSRYQLHQGDWSSYAVAKRTQAELEKKIKKRRK